MRARFTDEQIIAMIKEQESGEKTAGRGSSTISAEHGAGLEKRDFLAAARGSDYLDVMRRLISVLDPNGTLNPEKVLSSVAAT